MIRCRTNINTGMIKALAKYHTKNKKNAKRNKFLTVTWGLILLIISLINAYGHWLKYDGTKPVFNLIIKSSVFIIISIFILCMSIDGSITITHKLKQYFTQTNTTFIDYMIDDKGIRLILNGKSSVYNWNVIDQVDSDEHYYYFGSNRKYSVIEKSSISPENRVKLEKMFHEYFPDKL